MAIFAGMPVVAWWTIEHRLATQVAHTFWATTTPLQARWDIERFVQSTILANIYIAALGAVAVVIKLRDRDVLDPSLRFGVICGASCMLALAVLFVMNLHTPFIQPRYFSALIPVAAGGFAAFAALAPSRPISIAVATIVGAVTISVNAQSTTKSSGWEQSALVAKAAGAGCADTVVHARAFYDVGTSAFHALPGESQVTRAGYERAATAVGLSIAPANGHRVSARCPTIIWIEHQPPVGITPAGLARQAGLSVDPAAAIAARVWRSGSGMVIAYPAGATA